MATQTTTTHEKKWNCCNTVVSIPNENFTNGQTFVCSRLKRNPDMCVCMKIQIKTICSRICPRPLPPATPPCIVVCAAHICDYCNKKISDHSGKQNGYLQYLRPSVHDLQESYCSLDLNNHADLKPICRKGRHRCSNGNIEYGYCVDGCKVISPMPALVQPHQHRATVGGKAAPRITAAMMVAERPSHSGEDMGT